jgi:hypothetical protein
MLRMKRDEILNGTCAELNILCCLFHHTRTGGVDLLKIILECRNQRPCGCAGVSASQVNVLGSLSFPDKCVVLLCVHYFCSFIAFLH